MKQAQCGEGTVITIGHPANKCLAVKRNDGEWIYVETGKVVDKEDAFRGMWDIYTPLHSAPVVEGHLVERTVVLRDVRGGLAGPAEPGVVVIDSSDEERSF